METKITLQTVIRQKQGQVAADVDDEVVMMNLERGNYYGLNAVGSRIWKLLKEPMSVADLCRQLQQEYRVEPEQCRQDVLELLEQLNAETLLEIIDEQGSK